MPPHPHQGLGFAVHCWRQLGLNEQHLDCLLDVHLALCLQPQSTFLQYFIKATQIKVSSQEL